MTPLARRLAAPLPAAMACASALLGAATALAATTPAPAADAGRIAAQLARFREVRMPYDATSLTPRERRLVDKLVDATRLLDEVFWEQSDPQGRRLERRLAASTAPRDVQLRRLLTINGGRYDLVDENAPFAGAGPRPPGGNLFPADLTRAEFDAYVSRHPAQKPALYDPFTIVRRNGTALVAIPYHVAYRRWLVPMAKDLREAAALSEDPAFARFLRLRATALLTDDYLPSDLAWLDLADPRIDVIFAPYETYLDDFLGVKTSYGAAVLVRNEVESRKLDVFRQYVADIQDALPLAAEDRPSKRGHASPMEVMDAPYRGGDLRHGYQAVADNLPNDPRIHEQKGSKKIFFKNFMDARVEHVILPIAQRLMRSDQAPLATGDGYLTETLMHEIAHGLGPAFARTAAGKVDIREAIGPEYSGLEEAKATIVGLFGLRWLADHGRYPADKLAECYAAEVADVLRTVRFSVAEAHGRADIMEFNYFVEQRAITFDTTSGRYAMDLTRIATAVDALARELLEQEATGDRARTEAWFVKYGSVPAELTAALARAADVPIDVDPRFDVEAR